MSHASTDSQAESAPTTTEPDHDDDHNDHDDHDDHDDDEAAADLSPGLQEIHQDVSHTLETIDDHGEQIKRGVGVCFTAGGVDREAAGDLQELVVEQLSELSKEHDQITTAEIIAALWMELYRASGMLVGEDDDEEEQADDEAEDPDEAAAETDEEANAGSLGELFGDDDEATNGDAAEAPVDPAFQ